MASISTISALRRTLCSRLGTFSLPVPIHWNPLTFINLTNSILKTGSSNTLALALWSFESAGSIVDGLQLVADGTFSTALTIEDWNAAPNYAVQKAGREVAKVVPPT